MALWYHLLKNTITSENCGKLQCNQDQQTKDDVIRITTLFLKQFLEDNTIASQKAQIYMNANTICVLSKDTNSVAIATQDPNGQMFKDGTLDIVLSNTHGDIIPAMCKPGENSKHMKLCLKKDEGKRIAKVRFQTGYDAPVKDPLDLLRLIQNPHYSLSIRSGCDETQTHIIFINPPRGGSHLHALYLKYSKM